MKKNGFSRILACLTALLLVVSLCGCGDNSEGGGGSANQNSSNGNPSSGVVVTTDRMLVYTVNATMTVHDPDETIAALKAELSSVGGYEESSRRSESGYAYLTMRVPTEKLDAFLDRMQSEGEVNSLTVQSEDITDSYLTAVAQKEAYVAEKDALQALLDDCTDYDAIIKITERVHELLTRIEWADKQIKEYKSKADYSTIHLSLYADETYHAPSYWDELGEVLYGSTESVGTLFGVLLKILAALLPYTVTFAVIFGVYVLIKWVVCLCRHRRFTLFAVARENAKMRRREREIERERRRRSLGMDASDET